MKEDGAIVRTNHLFRSLARELIRLLQSLDGAAWMSKTCYPNWRVHDIATHLLFTAVSRLSAARDRFRDPDAPSFPRDYESLSDAIDAANTRWAEAWSRVSPRLVVDFLKLAEYQLADYLSSLEQRGRSSVGIAWAGEEHPERWFETAREFSERWHHQQQIRDAVGAPSIAQPRYLRPVLSTLVRAVPYWYSSIDPREPTEVEIRIMGQSGGIWTVAYEAPKWQLHVGASLRPPAATVTMSEDTAWRFFTRSIGARGAESRIQFGGDRALSHRFLDVVSVMIPRSLR